MPMKNISTPSTIKTSSKHRNAAGPSRSALAFLHQFARVYSPAKESSLALPGLVLN